MEGCNIALSFQNIHVIVNPASGSDVSPVDEITAHFSAAGVAWQLHETGSERSACELAQESVAQGADVVIACGGDGTVAGVAEGLLDSTVPLGIIPQGTANVFAAELQLPLALPQILTLFTGGSAQMRQVDVGQVGKHCFLLRVGIGWEAAMTILTPGNLKVRYGRWAYLVTALRIRRRLRAVRYRLIIDGQERVAKGVSCVICNSGNIGLPGLKLLPEIEITDGLLNVVVIRRADWNTLLSLAVYVLRCALSGYQIEVYPPHALFAWTGREIQVIVEPAQIIARDGEVIETGYPVKIQIRPAALRVVVPA